MNRLRAARSLIAAVSLLVIAATAGGCGDEADKSPQLDGIYRTDLTRDMLDQTFPDSGAPAGRWTMKIDTKLDFVEVGAPDGVAHACSGWISPTGSIR